MIKSMAKEFSNGKMAENTSVPGFKVYLRNYYLFIISNIIIK